jgi:phosphatidylserine/phosphatidylglycerophosphate/cardiolipin synthase-like enzyme
MTAGDIRVVVSGSSWMGGGSGSIDSAIRHLFSRSNDEIVIVAYTISGAAADLFQQFTMLLQRGIRIRMLINRYNELRHSVKDRLGQLQQQFPGLFRLYSFVPPHEQADLHAKIILVDRIYALVGSANLSLRGLMDNHELGLVLEGAAVAGIVRAVELLLHSPQVIAVPAPVS